MIFAMHQTQIYSLVKHGNTEALREFVEETVDKQLLLASATTELGIGGDVSRSYCAVEDLGGHLLLIKNAPVISYGEHSDAIVVTARRNTGESAERSGSRGVSYPRPDARTHHPSGTRWG